MSSKVLAPRSATRGMLSHWMVIKDGIISNYRADTINLELWSA
ncbi:hypothetical protein ACLB1E_11230 [Escherichia coli]